MARSVCFNLVFVCVCCLRCLCVLFVNCCVVLYVSFLCFVCLCVVCFAYDFLWNAVRLLLFFRVVVCCVHVCLKRFVCVVCLKCIV